MSSVPVRPISEEKEPTPRPAWEIAYLFPPQGMWSEEEYLELEGHRLVEFIDGKVEVLTMPTPRHQAIVALLYRLLFAFVDQKRLGNVLFSPLPVRTVPRQYREPDLVFLAVEHEDRVREQCWAGADLVMEVVSEDDRHRDFITKRFEYAQAGIPEYWIVDPANSEITVLGLAGEKYEEHGVFRVGEHATSVLLQGFAVDVQNVFAVK